jgi:hypothetical protein
MKYLKWWKCETLLEYFYTWFICEMNNLYLKTLIFENIEYKSPLVHILVFVDRNMMGMIHMNYVLVYWTFSSSTTMTHVIWVI